MDDMEDKLSAILNNPQLMQQIMTMAQSLGQNTAESPPAPAGVLPDIDPGMVQKLSGLAGQSGIDQQQQALLSALGPYLSRDRVSRLERAMRAQKMARMATALLGPNTLSLLTGR